jgi:choline dehydrogenase-like flavoprotein
MEPGPEGIPLKRLFGSDVAFRETANFADVVCERSDLKMSLAFGGLSTVWGAGLIPFCPDDIKGWPIGIEALAPYYRECLEEMDLAAAADDLAEGYPLYTERYGTLRPSRQAAELLADLQRAREPLLREGIRFGTSRLAVKASRPGSPQGCVYCGLCLYGCPYGFIYNSADWVRASLSRPEFSYQPDVIVERVEEHAGAVTLHARRRQTKEAVKYSGCSAFLACGAIPTTAVLLESLGAWDRQVEMRDSQYFIFPMVRFRKTKGVHEEQLHTLAQVFLEIHDPRVSTKGIHISVYSYNDLLGVALRRQLALFGPLARGLSRALVKRLLVFGGYLHSDESPSIQFSLRRSPTGGKEVHLEGLERSSSDRIVSRLLRKLAAESTRLKALPLTPFVRKGLPGRGFHSGGTFPMAERPKDFQSDTAGRPNGFSRVHVVDASVFPSIPAPNLTFTVMANARRIVALACQS